MEGAEHGGERATGGLEDGGSASRAPGSPSHGCEGPQDESRSREAPETEEPHRINEGPGDNARIDETPGCTGTDEGPRHTGTSADEGPHRIDEGPGDTSRSHGTPSRTGANEGPKRTEGPHRTSTDEGPGDTSRSHGTPSRIGANEGLKRTEGPHRTRTSTDEGPGDTSRSHGTPSRTGTGANEGPKRAEGPHRTSTDEGPRRIDEGPGDASRSYGTPSHTGTSTDEGPLRTRVGADEGPGDASRSYGTSSHTGTSTDEGPLRTRVGADEGPGDNSRSHETPSHSRTGADEGTRHVEGPRRTRAGAAEGTGHTGTVCTDEHEVSKDPDVPRDITASQRNAGACATEGPHAPGTCIEGPHAPRTTPSKELSDDGAPKEPSDDGAPKEPDGDPNSWDNEGPHAPRTCHEGPHAPGTSPPKELCDEERPPAPGGHPSSFKKPVTPGRPVGHEKGLDPRTKPDGEAAPDVGLPSDAYRTSPAIPYREPPWSGHPPALYSLEILKGGAILSTKDLSGAAWTVFGRLPACHVALEHPSVSRFHAVLQYRSAAGDRPDQERGFYVHDLGSTHGTFVNKLRIPPKTFRRIRVGHVMKFGGSTRLFILQGPEEDQEAESDLTVTQIKEVRRQKEDLQKRMLGDDSDEEDEPSDEGKKSQAATGEEAGGCMWGMGEDAIEEENEENPIAMEFQEEREASYIKNPKKALQGFFDREGEELEFEYEERSPGSWLCRVKLPADDCAGKQLVAEVTHSGKKKDAANLCSLEACRMLEMRGLLRQEAVSRKRKAKKWEDEDFYDSDDDTFLDRTGVVEKKRLNRMKKAGKIEEKPETFESLSAKLELVEKEMTEVAAKLKTSHTDVTQPSTQDSLDAFMTEIKAESSLDSVSRRKLHLQSLELKKEQQRLKSLITIVRPTKLPELQATSSTDDSKPKKLNLPMFGAMKGGSKFKLKTGTVGKLLPKRTDLPASLFTMKDTEEPEEEEEDEDEQMKVENAGDGCSEYGSAVADTAMKITKIDPAPEIQTTGRAEEMQTASPEKRQEVPERSANARPLNGQKKPETSTDEKPKPAAERPKKMHGPSKPPRGVLNTRYPEDDPDYCVWTPPAGQSGDGKTHLNDKYGY